MKRAALYMRVSTLDQHPETQLYDLHEMAKQRGYRIVEEYEDRISGAKAGRPGLDAMMRDARRGQFDVVLVWACDRIARSTKHFLERSLIVERVRAGMRRAKLEGRHIGRDRAAILRDRQQGHSLGQLAKSYLVSRTTIHRVIDEQIPAVTKGLQKPAA